MNFLKRIALLMFVLVASLFPGGRSKAEVEDWIAFKRDGKPEYWLITVNRAMASDEARTPRYCIKLDYEFDPIQLANGAFPTPEVLSDCHALEERICGDLSRSGCREAGSKMGNGKRTVWFCGDQPSLLDDATRVLERLAGPKAKLVDASFAEVRELLPTLMEDQIAKNEILLGRLAADGDIADRPRTITHWIYEIDEPNRKAVIAQLKQRGYSIDTIENDKIIFHRTGAASLDEFNSETRALNDLCDQHECLYDGWETEIVRQ